MHKCLEISKIYNKTSDFIWQIQQEGIKDFQIIMYLASNETSAKLHKSFLLPLKEYKSI